ncbi:hypothetical protein BTR23_25380 [Alkalihalophilus pseudofirmus]|nr:hypothetical protein BTR23_25380 [Alkalihalophilus pseudofirmus]
MTKLRPLVTLTIISVLFLVVYYSIVSEPSYPIQTVSKEEAIEAIEVFSKKMELNIDVGDRSPTIETRANESIGQYITKENWTNEEIERLTNEIPIYTISIVLDNYLFEVDPFTSDIVRANNLYIHVENYQEINNFLENLFGSGFAKVEEKKDVFGDIDYIYSRGEVAGEIEEKVRISVYDNTILAFHKYGEVDQYPLSTEIFNLWEILMALVFIVTIVVVAIVATVQLVKKLNNNQIEAFLGPTLISLLAGVGWFCGLYLAMGTVDMFSLLFSGALTYATFSILLITAKKTDYVQPFSQIAEKLQPAVWNGFLLMIVSTSLTTIFYGLSAYFGAWSSPVMDYAVFLNTPLWAVPVFALSLGICASISEETIFRRYLIPAFDRFGVVISVLATSFLWGIGHIGYHMVPWHIRIFEFVLIVGPFFYFVYKRYGFVTAIFCHFFYNSMIGSIFLLTIIGPVGLLSVVLTLVPFLVFLKRSRGQRRKLLFRT